MNYAEYREWCLAGCHITPKHHQALDIKASAKSNPSPSMQVDLFDELFEVPVLVTPALCPTGGNLGA